MLLVSGVMLTLRAGGSKVALGVTGGVWGASFVGGSGVVTLAISTSGCGDFFLKRVFVKRIHLTIGWQMQQKTKNIERMIHITIAIIIFRQMPEKSRIPVMAPVCLLFKQGRTKCVY